MIICSAVVMRSTRRLWDTYPAGAAALALGKEQGGTLQHRPGGGPVFPAWQKEEKRETSNKGL